MTTSLATVLMQNTNGIALKRSSVHNSGMYGVYLHTANIYGLVDRCWVHNTASFGVFIENYPGVSPDIGDVNTRNAVIDTKVNDAGEIFGGGSCIHIRNATNNVVDHVELFNSPRAALEIYGADPAAVGAGSVHGDGNSVQYANGHNVVQDSDDMGAFYVALTANKRNYFVQIIGDHAAANSSIPNGSVAPSCIFTDIGSQNQTFANVNCTNIQNGQRDNNSGGASTETNVSWLGGFDVTKMASDIGVRSDFPAFPN